MSHPHDPHPERTPSPTPGTGPTPEDPREHEPVRDPPIYPEHDDDRSEGVRQADDAEGVMAPDRAPDEVVYDSPD